VAIPVKAEWGAGAYLVALAHRPLDMEAKRQPGRALGLAWFAVDRSKRNLEVSVNGPAQMRPRGPLTVPVRVAGLQPGEQARVTVAAVDVGILNLTRYQAPNPGEHFFGQKQLSTEIRDLYGYLIDGMQGTRGAIRSGGDAEASVEGAPPVQEPLARYSGVVAVGSDGQADVTFDIPAFNGTVPGDGGGLDQRPGRPCDAGRDRARSRGGRRHPAALPLGRATSPASSSRSTTWRGAAGEYTIDLDIRGPVVAAADALRRKVALKAGGKATVSIPLAAAGAGTAELGVRITGPGIDAAQSFSAAGPARHLLAREPHRAPAASRRQPDPVARPPRRVLPAPALCLGRGVAVTALGVPGLLQSSTLPLRLPSRTVSGRFPPSLRERDRGQRGPSVDTALERALVRDAVDRVLSRPGLRQAPSACGSAGRGVTPWPYSYVADLLTAAGSRGLAVPLLGFTACSPRPLRNFAGPHHGRRREGRELAYAAMCWPATAVP
jgi:uncharacterized protein YfaS (alpha-2-macroglobulin family)